MPGILPEPEGPSTKVHVTSGSLPPYISPSEAPTKKAPWRTVRNVGFVQTVTATLPEELYDIIWREIEASLAIHKYSKVIMKLEDVLQGDFFNGYIKRGNILMLSEGEPGVDEVFSLRQGVLRLELAQEVYKRAGLQGVPIRSGGRKHVKSRYVVENNLRLPSMLRGKKGFDRLLWAAKNVLNRSLCWLFVDLSPNKESEEDQRPINAHHPNVQSLSPLIQTVRNVQFPLTLTAPISTFPGPRPPEEIQESIHDLFEFIDMLALASPRVQTTDSVDSFISGYRVPDPPESDKGSAPVSGTRSASVKVVTWAGLLPAQWTLDILCAIIKHSRAKDLSRLDRSAQWLGLTVTAHKAEPVGQTDGYTVLLRPVAESKLLPDAKGGDDPESPLADTKDGDDMVMKDSTGDHDTAEAEFEGQLDGAGAKGRDVQMADDMSSDKKAIKTCAGFYRYLCAEYVDSLT
ncbi:hypothetical protein PV08_08575 [Exophiala spinifera]|uniref:Uncharacterized protein n=1 Tax=Exophiala spinifera TaxID=91928 RepID=A0A0D1ZKN2_9EURO|nr:uncharacterized protein PV08_08575 [Exophiala spinifera]KIW13387.1 hypothetical protein PV08_08575 [Exophiala spinifera]